MSAASLTGIFCPVTTPFHAERVVTEKLRSNIELYNETGLAGYVVLGSTGEPVFLDEAERLSLVSAVKASIRNDMKLIVGTGYESTRKTVAFTKQAADLGADFALVVTPNYYKNHISYAGLRMHYLEVAEHSGIPVLIYNVPAFTGIDLRPDLVAELSGHPNIVGVKDSTSRLDKLLALMNAVDDAFSVLIGNIELFVHGLFMGAPGAIMNIVNIAPERCVSILDSMRSGKSAQAWSQLETLLPIARRMLAPHGIPAIKAAMDLLGYYGGAPRHPFLPLGDLIRENLHGLLGECGLVTTNQD